MRVFKMMMGALTCLACGVVVVVGCTEGVMRVKPSLITSSMESACVVCLFIVNIICLFNQTLHILTSISIGTVLSLVSDHIWLCLSVYVGVLCAQQSRPEMISISPYSLVCLGRDTC